MTNKTKRTELNPESEVSNKALAEDTEDMAAFEERVKEPIISYDEMVKRLKADGRWPNIGSTSRSRSTR